MAKFLAQLFALFVMLALSIIMLTFLLITTAYFNQIGQIDVNLYLLYFPSKYDSTLSVLLETTDPLSDFQMKEILTAAAIQNNRNVNLHGKDIDAGYTTERIMSKYISGPYLVRIASPEIILYSRGTLGSVVQKASVPLYTPEGAKTLELVVGT
ncbi:MAG TPA: hypothetical protein VJH90_03205 [archaeon]|nr:hypothetical protein [archaeon]